MKRIACALLALLLCMPLLVACGGGNKLRIVADGACTVLYDDTQLTDEQVQQFVADIEESLSATVELIAASSFLGEVTASPNTIILGNVDIEACRAATEALRSKDYVVGVYGDLYVIAGKTVNATTAAMNYFRREILPPEEEGADKLTVSTKSNHRHDGSYAINGMTIGGVPLSQCEIVIPKNCSASEYRTAILLKELLLTKTGYVLPIVKENDAAAVGRISIGASICSQVDVSVAHSYAMGVSGSVLEIAAESLYGYEEAIRVLQDQVLHQKKDAYPLDNSFSLTGNGAARATAPLTNDAELRLLYNNVWGGTDGDEKQRMGQLVELYLEYLPDVIGLQECSEAMRNAGIDKLWDLGYAEVATPGVVPRTPLFYRTDTLEVLESGYLSLHDLDFANEKYAYLLPAGVSSANMRALMQQDRTGPDDDSSKSLTWAIFRIKATGHVFFAGSTHLWWQGRDQRDDAARIIQMETMKAYAVRAAAYFMSYNALEGQMPIYIGGDYNSRMSRDSYHSMGSNTVFENINNLVAEAERLKLSTMHNYPTYNEERGLWEVGGSPRGEYPSALDHIFACSMAQSTYQVARIKMLEEDYAFLSSDHSPIFADLNFTSEAPILSAVQ